jgi:hypothetical protein
MSEQTRRAFAADAVRAATASVAVGTATAGCLGGGSEDAPPDVDVFNDTDADVTASVTATAADGDDGDAEDPYVSETTTIEAKDAAEYADALPGGGTYALAVNVEDGPTAAETQSLSGESGSLQAVIHADAIEFRTR